MRPTIVSTRPPGADRHLLVASRAQKRPGHANTLPRWGVPSRSLSAAVVALCLLLYGLLGYGWETLALLLLAPDLAALAFLAGPRWGAHAYDATHRTPAPALAAGIGVVAGVPLVTTLGLIWLIHIAIDWLLGYGLFVTPLIDRTTRTSVAS